MAQARFESFSDWLTNQKRLFSKGYQNYKRSQIGIVSQEPILFDSTIRENIQMGNLDVTQEEIDNALVQANAAEFVSKVGYFLLISDRSLYSTYHMLHILCNLKKLPNGIETYAGEGGATLSGGQKQRIAIARALVRNPKILLLDEATSALDTESEKLVQIALERAASGRTTIIVAHRLSTIKNADKICGFSDGKIIEEGNHESLMELENGVYFNLCNMQTFEPEGPDVESEKETSKAEDKTTIKTEAVKETKTEDEKIKEPEAEDVSIWKIMALNGPEICINITGSFFAFVLGAVQPTFAFVFAGVLGVFGRYGCSYDNQLSNFVETIDENDASTDLELINGLKKYKETEFCSEDALMDEIIFYSCMFIVIGVADLLLHGGTSFLFGLSGEKLTMRLRRESFKKYLNLEMAYFDSPFNSTGALTARLAGDAAKGTVSKLYGGVYKILENNG